MCGRYTAQNPNELGRRFPALQVAADLDARFNVAPTQRVPVALNDGRRQITKARWGLIPNWATSVEEQKLQPINAKLETIAESRLFAPLLKTRRCLLFADGFFEWKTVGKIKTPIYFRLKSREPFAFAGLWDIWHDSLISCTLLTGPPNELVAPIHNRMPVMLDPAAAMTWIREGDANLTEFLPMLQPYAATEMESYAVSPRLNKVKADTPDLIVPVPEAPTLF